MEEDDFKKLPLHERCVQKFWKARVRAYEELTKLFGQIDDEKSPEFGRYAGLIKKFVVDSCAAAQERGLETALAFIQNYALAGRTASEVMSGVVTECMAAPKTRTRKLAMQVTLAYVEIEKFEIVQEELVKGIEHTNPKIVAASINACTTILREFGPKILKVKLLLKKMEKLLAGDKTVRAEAKLMVVEIYKWIGPDLKSQLNNLQPELITELETEFDKVKGQKPSPVRFIRSEKQKQAAAPVDGASKIIKIDVILDQVRPDLPEEAPEVEQKSVEGGEPVATSPNAEKPEGSASSTKAAPVGSKREDVDVGTSLLLSNNMKYQRTLDLQVFDLSYMYEENNIPILPAADIKSEIMPSSPPKPLDLILPVSRLNMNNEKDQISTRQF